MGENVGLLKLPTDIALLDDPEFRQYIELFAKAWIEEMAFYVKSIDPKHLVEIGTEGFYGVSTPNRAQINPNSYAQQVGTDFIRNHQVLGVDFASVHMYPDSWISQ